VTGWALRAHRLVPAWVAWLGTIAGVCAIAARAVWTSPFWLVGYALFLVWTLAICSLLVARTFRAVKPGPDHHPTMREEG
jgi:membrane protein implicated in regulation of membrane protease activity